MKKLVALILVCLLCVGTAFAGEWPEGLGPGKPFPGVREIDTGKEMGYYFLIPKEGFEVAHFCDVLEIYLPREDIKLGEGHAHLFDSNGEVLDIDFANPEQVELRPMEQVELDEFPHPWGGGTCIEMFLPVSLRFGESYYVVMDLNCFTDLEGKVSNYDLVEPNANGTNDSWIPLMVGDYGVGGLYYCAAAPQPTEEELEQMEEAPEDAEPTEAAEEAGPIEPKYTPGVGDEIHFDLLLGGDAKTAVVFSENDSAYFEVLEYNESCTVTGTVTKEDLSWGVVFLDENDEMVNALHLK